MTPVKEPGGFAPKQCVFVFCVPKNEAGICGGGGDVGGADGDGGGGG